MTNALYYGMGPVFVLGCALGYSRLWYMWSVALRFRLWQPGMKYKSIYKFDTDLDVEARCHVSVFKAIIIHLFWP